MIPYLNPVQSRGLAKITANPLTEANYRSNDEVIYDLLSNLGIAKTGVCITQLMRPLPMEYTLKYNRELLKEKPKPVDTSDPALFDPYECRWDYWRLGSRITKKRVEWLKAFLCPKQTEYGISTSVYRVDTPFHLVNGVRVYQNHFRDALTGAVIAYNPVTLRYLPFSPKILLWLAEIDGMLALEMLSEEEADLVDVVIDLGGQWMDGKDMLDLWRIGQHLNELGFRPMRDDLKIDFPKSLGVLEGIKHCHEHNLVRGVRTGQLVPQKKAYADPDTKEHDGVYLGSRYSEFMGRAYPTKTKHGFDAHRFESEFKGDKGRVAWAEIMSLTPYLDPNDKSTRMSNEAFKRILQQKASEICLGQVVFCEVLERKANRAIKREVVAPFWAKAMDKALCHNPRKIRIPAPEKSIGKTLRWMYKQVSSTLAELSEGLKEDFYPIIREMMGYAKQKFTDKNTARIEAIAQVRGILVKNFLGQLTLEYADTGTMNHKFTDYDQCHKLTEGDISKLRQHHKKRKSAG